MRTSGFSRRPFFVFLGGSKVFWNGQKRASLVSFWCVVGVLYRDTLVGAIQNTGTRVYGFCINSDPICGSSGTGFVVFCCVGFVV